MPLRLEWATRAEAMAALRRAKQDVALTLGLADLAGAIALEAVTALAHHLRRRGARGGAPLRACRRRAQPANGAADTEPRRLLHPRHGEVRRRRAQLFQRHRHHRALRSGGAGAWPTASSRRPSGCRIIRQHRRAAAGAHGRRLRLPHRPAAAARSGGDARRALRPRRRSSTTRAWGRTGSAPP